MSRAAAVFNLLPLPESEFVFSSSGRSRPLSFTSIRESCCLLVPPVSAESAQHVRIFSCGSSHLSSDQAPGCHRSTLLVPYMVSELWSLNELRRQLEGEVSALAAECDNVFE